MSVYRNRTTLPPIWLPTRLLYSSLTANEGDMGHVMFQRLNEEAFFVIQLDNIKPISNRNISRTFMNK
ncbi:MAG: hypothetical protein ACXVI9_05460, partial [Mucilaginibacter sp.]